MDIKTAQAEQHIHRLIPSRFPLIAAFEDVVSTDDAAAVMELEGWTDDRLVQERLNRLPRNRWAFGEVNSSIVMATFLHVAPSGLRFNSNELGAWYATYELKTAIAEVAHHLRREAICRRNEMRLQYRQYVGDLVGEFISIRGQHEALPDLYDPGDYTASQRFGEQVRGAGTSGIIYDSVRHQGGISAVAYNPKNILNVTMGAHFEIIAPLHGKVIARTLKSD